MMESLPSPPRRVSGPDPHLRGEDQQREDADPDPRMGRAIELDPKDGFYLVHRGDSYRAKGDTQKAFADYEMAIKTPTKKGFPGMGLSSRAVERLPGKL